MQFRPRLTGASGSPGVATTLLFCTPTSTEQPVPQKRHGALSQRMTLLALACSADSTVVGTAMPAVAAAAATALALMKSRLFSDMVELPLPVAGLAAPRRTPRRCPRLIRKPGLRKALAAPCGPR